MVSAVQIGKGGVVHNFGLPKLSKSELEMFERTALVLKEREQMACDFVHRDQCSLPAFVVKEMEDEKALQQGIIR